MKKIMLSILLIALSATFVSAQGVLGKIKNRVKNTVENRTVNNVGQKSKQSDG